MIYSRWKEEEENTDKLKVFRIYEHEFYRRGGIKEFSFISL